jgi:hypothetical protein
MTSLGAHIGALLAVVFLASLVAEAIRLRDPRVILGETVRLCVQITVGIFLFCGVVIALEWFFVRSPF